MIREHPSVCWAVTALVMLAGCAGVAPLASAPRSASLVELTPLPPVGEAVDGPIFEDVTEEVGLQGGAAAAWGDYDNDGWVDLYTSGALWRNDRGRFTRVHPHVVGGKGLWGDFDNDGYLDLFTCEEGRLYRNLAGEGFEEVTDMLPERGEHVSRGAVWGDFNGDGYLDIYYGGYEVWTPSRDYADFLYLNQSGRSFILFWQSPKLERARGVTAADYDQDGDLDIYVSNYRLQRNRMWQNDGAAGLTDVAADIGVAGDREQGAFGHTIGSSFGDLDNDGYLDLFVGNFSHPPTYQDRPKFLRNRGPEHGWTFEDKSASAGLAWQESFASPALGDFDNDGHLDLYFTAVYSGDHNVLYRNNGNWTFTDVTDASGLAKGNTYAAAWADFDNDGDLDLFTAGRLFRNRGNAGHRLKVRLIGGYGINAAAIGAQVLLRFDDETLTRQVEGATGEGNQNELTLHFGLGEYSGSVHAEVRWPGGEVETFDLPADHLATIHYRPSLLARRSAR